MAIPRAHAQTTPATFTWTGAISGDAANDLNWSVVEADHTNPGLGDPLNPDSVIFGEITTFSGVTIPAPGVALRDVTFNATTTSYTISGDSEESTTLNLFGNVLNTTTGQNITLASSLNVALLGQSSEGSLMHTVCVLSCSTITVNGVIGEIAETGSAGINKNGSGTLVLTGTNTFTGGVTVNNGTLRVGNGSALGTGNLKLYDGTTLGVTSGSCITLANAIALDCNTCTTVTINLGCSDTLKLTGNISGAAELAQTGGGTLTLSGANDFTGGVAVHGGTLLVGNDSAVGTGTLKLYDGTSLGVTTGGSFTLANAISLDCRSCTTVTIDLGCSDSLVLNGTISGAAGLVQNGGTLTLSGQNTFTGGVTVQSDATLILGSSSHESLHISEEEGPSDYAIDYSPVGLGTLKLDSGSTLSLKDSCTYILHNDIDLGCSEGTVKIDTNCGAISLYGYISGSAGITKKGDGTLAFYNGDNDFTGGVTVKRGTLVIGADSAMGYGEGDSWVVVSGPVGTGTLKFETNCTTPTLALANNGCYILHNAIDLGCFDGTVTIDTLCGDLTLAGDITGSAMVGLTKVGGGSLTLEGNNSFEGDFKVKAGTVNAETNSALGQGILAFCSSDGATVNFDSLCPTISGLSGTNCNDLIYLNGIEATPAHLTIDQCVDLSFAGKIMGDGSVTKTGNGNLTLSGASTFSGGLTIAAGTITLSGSSVTSTDTSVDSSPVGTGNLTIADAAKLSVLGTGVKLLNNVVLAGSPGATQTFFMPEGYDLTIGDGTLGTISGNGRLNKSGLGTLTLATANSYTGGTSVGGGVLVISADNNLGAAIAPVTLSLDSGTLRTTASFTLDPNRSVILSSTNGGTFSPDGGTTLTFAGVISGGAPLTKSGAGTLNLGGANTYTGATTISGGTLALGAANSLPATTAVTVATGATFDLAGFSSSIAALAGAGNVTLGSATLTTTGNSSPIFSGIISGTGGLTKEGNGTLELTGENTFTGSTTINAGGILIGDGGTTGSLAGNIINNGSLEFARSNALTYAGVISGTGQLTKSSTGTLTLTGTNTYTGPTFVSGGTLVAGNDSALGNSAVTLNGGKLVLAPGINLTGTTLTVTSGTLAGNWTFNTAQSFASGVSLSPGNSPGTMTFTAGLTLNNGNTLNVEINGATDAPGSSSDLMDVRNSSTHDSYLNVGSLGVHGYTLNIISLDLIGGDVAGAVNGLTGPASWTIFKTDGLVGTFDANNFDLVSSQFFGGGNFALTQVGNDLVLNFTPVPEPSTYALMGLGLCLSGFAAWRKRRRA